MKKLLNKLMQRGEAPKPQSTSVLRRALSTVPAVTFGFWVTKVLTTGMGETGADYLFHDTLGTLYSPNRREGVFSEARIQEGA